MLLPVHSWLGAVAHLFVSAFHSVEHLVMGTLSGVLSAGTSNWATNTFASLANGPLKQTILRSRNSPDVHAPFPGSTPRSGTTRSG